MGHPYAEWRGGIQFHCVCIENNETTTLGWLSLPGCGCYETCYTQFDIVLDFGLKLMCREGTYLKGFPPVR